MRQYNFWVKAAYNNTKTSFYFSLKSPFSYLFESDVVYKFTCSRDETMSYIGETRRQLFQRIIDHNGNDTNKHSAVFNHMFKCTGCVEVDNISKSFIIL